MPKATLKSYLQTALNTQVTQQEKTLQELRHDQERAKRLNTTNFEYRVMLNSLWEGENDVVLATRGTIEDAVRHAEQAFLERNNRSDIQADYAVSVKIGHGYYHVPDSFWEQYKQKRS